MRGKTRYFVTFAPGHYGDAAAVLSAHFTYWAALRAIADTTTLCVRYDESGSKRKGDRMRRAVEALYPLATGDEPAAAATRTP